MRAHLGRSLGSGLARADFNVSHAEDYAVSVAALKARGDALKLVMGHRVTRRLAMEFASRPLRLATVLREPVSWMVSKFNWDFRESGLEPGSAAAYAAFRRWVAGNRNYQARWLLTIYDGQDAREVRALDDAALLARAGDVLEGFWCVGCVSDIAGSLAPFFDSLGIAAPFTARRNVAGSDYPRLVDAGDPELRAFIESHGAVDRQLHGRHAHGGRATGA